MGALVPANTAANNYYYAACVCINICSSTRFFRNRKSAGPVACRVVSRGVWGHWSVGVWGSPLNVHRSFTAERARARPPSLVFSKSF